MDALTELAIKYKTDKWGKHHFTPFYYDLFRNNSKRRKVKKVLEIGVAEGAGLFMFRDFFPNATIYGAEIDQVRVDKLQGLDRIQVFKCDQSSKPDLIILFSEVGFDIDLIIDDGSHKPEDQVFTCLSTLLFLKRGAVYVIEDVADESIADEIGSELRRDFGAGLNKFSKPEVIKVGKRYDDRLVIIKNG